MAMGAVGGRRYIGMLVVLSLALLSWWFLNQERSMEGRESHDSHVVDYSMRDFEVTAMDDLGRPRHRLSGVSMQHYVDDGSSMLEKPELLLYLPTAQQRGPAAVDRWVLQAERAQIDKSGSQALLEGDVQVQHIDASGVLTQSLRTRDLQVRIDQQRAESGEPVEIRERHGVTRAQGLKIDLKAGEIELLAAVRGEYVWER